MPWILAGDFNAIIDDSERQGGANRNIEGMIGCDLFRNFIFKFGLTNMGFFGPRFTWSRGTLHQRLDRALCNDA